MEVSYEHKVKFLESYGWTVGARDPRLNTDYEGRFMVVEAHDESELPTANGCDGPWCLVGDDLPYLVDEAFDWLFDSDGKGERVLGDIQAGGTGVLP